MTRLHIYLAREANRVRDVDLGPEQPGSRERHTPVCCRILGILFPREWREMYEVQMILENPKGEIRHLCPRDVEEELVGSKGTNGGFNYGGIEGVDLVIDWARERQTKVQSFFLHGGTIPNKSSLIDLMDEIQDLGFPFTTQPEGLKVTLRSDQLSTLNFMLTQERSEIGIEDHLWAPVPAVGSRMWYSPFFDAFTTTPPQSFIKGGFLADEMGYTYLHQDLTGD